LVRVEDIYGNARESTVYSFSTDKSFTVDEVESKADSQAPMHLNSDIYRSDDNYLVRLKATKPVSIEIATYDMPSFPLLKKRSNETPVNHIPLKNIYETNLLMCEICHRASNDNFSHQVHSRAKLGSNIPAEYSRLPNGQINCLTCHLQHASKNQFHLRESSGRKLCIGCHKRSFRNR
jgi:predicted CXXCH cytochrome family protein